MFCQNYILSNKGCIFVYKPKIFLESYIIWSFKAILLLGKLSRLYKGLKGNKEEKLNRQQSFIEHYGKEVINYNKKDWIVISKIRRSDLLEEEAESEIFYELIHSLFSAMLSLETIGP